MRVGIIAVQHESNTFLDGSTSWDDFVADVVAEGDRVRDVFGEAHHEIGGFFAGLDELDIEAVPLFVARAIPSGVIGRETAERLVERVEQAAHQARRLDGLLVAPHGAAVSELDRDFDGCWLQRLRRIVGPRVPVVATLDLHANVSKRMIEACQATIAYHTNPHVDQRERGIEAARLLGRALTSGSPLTQCAALLPLAVGLEKQNTAEQPSRWLYQTAGAAQHHGGPCAVSPLLGFPYADVAEMGGSVIVVTENDRKLARDTCIQLARDWWARRSQFTSSGLSAADAIERASRLAGPVGLLDMGDNVGGGSPGDGTVIAHEVVRRGGPRTLVCLYDPEMAARAAKVGVGGTVDQWRIGGKHDTLHGEPLTVNGTIAALTDGKFHESEVRHGGKSDYDMGTTAVIETNKGLTLIVHSVRTPPFSAGQVTSTGVDPRMFQVIVLKGVQAPIAAYRPFCRTFLHVNTPGVTTTDLRRLEYVHRRRPLYPFEGETTWDQTIIAEGA